jgi:hypothetical protein
MSKRKGPEASGEEGGLEDLLMSSIESLRRSPSQRLRYPALDRLFRRMETHDQRESLRFPAAVRSTGTWLRYLLPATSSAAAGFAGAALALLLLHDPPFTGPSSTGSAAPVAAPMPQDASERLASSIRALEQAVHGLEKFQPLVESRIEWVEDALQRKHRDAYAAGGSTDRAERLDTAPSARPRNGV